MQNEYTWIELSWIELNGMELNWVELNWTELNWIELNMNHQIGKQSFSSVGKWNIAIADCHVSQVNSRRTIDRLFSFVFHMLTDPEANRIYCRWVLFHMLFSIWTTIYHNVIFHTPTSYGWLVTLFFQAPYLIDVEAMRSLSLIRTWWRGHDPGMVVSITRREHIIPYLYAET